ncbi:hypothetical protein SAMN05421810_103267 [Amycolatopsis arida]|uniref:Uncharacterized protein n=1 Tax=Amycolatopsis arida TaxID=587909 RepID=A0A1I5STD6_9PSEU|nr:hypothetical protein CLV69_103491 [Amycolatopsis arida]SFP74064.1 hypothetical protein SAMN05421810_103267 [Amycolatopsis arida]
MREHGASALLAALYVPIDAHRARFAPDHGRRPPLPGSEPAAPERWCGCADTASAAVGQPPECIMSAPAGTHGSSGSSSQP